MANPPMFAWWSPLVIAAEIAENLLKSIENPNRVVWDEHVYEQGARWPAGDGFETNLWAARRT